jgi:hypothetical protein
MRTDVRESCHTAVNMNVIELGKSQFRDLGVDGRIILKMVSKEIQ